MSTPSLSRAGWLAEALSGARRWVILGMLLALHGALVATPESGFQRMWLLVHFGLFLVWQPFFAAQEEVGAPGIALLLLITGATLYFLPPWLIAAWIAILLAILGGKVFTVEARRPARFYLVAFLYLAAMLLLWVVPRLVLKLPAIPEPVVVMTHWALPALLLLLAVLPLDRREVDSHQIFDFFYALLLFQLLVVLSLGSVALMRYTGGEYFRAAVLMVVGFGASLVVLAVLWAPRGGFGGLRLYLSRYLLSVGMPFETWMRQVAELAEREKDPQRFLGQALGLVDSLAWVKGGRWRTQSAAGEFGKPGEHEARFQFYGMEFTFFTEVALSPALMLHLRLLAQVIAEFHESKRREGAIRANAYMQAVHETGARLTHDVKNLLQSLYTLTAAAPKAGEDAAAYAGLLDRQLPQLTRRLRATLDQLRVPQSEARSVPRSARAWWADVEQRYAGSPVELSLSGEGDAVIPVEAFEAFLENGLANAERAGWPGARAALAIQGAHAELTVANRGDAVAPEIASRLFHEPVPASTGDGLGIGLYQVGRLAAEAGYRAELAVNEPGNVVFRLHPA